MVGEKTVKDEIANGRQHSLVSSFDTQNQTSYCINPGNTNHIISDLLTEKNEIVICKQWLICLLNVAQIITPSLSMIYINCTKKINLY